MPVILLTNLTSAIDDLWARLGNASGFIHADVLTCRAYSTSEYAIYGCPLVYKPKDAFRYFLWRRPCEADSLGDMVTAIPRGLFGSRLAAGKQVGRVRHYQIDNLPEQTQSRLLELILRSGYL
ncbi:MAG: hypothetical protein JWO07_592 [Candidatus Saccharibacteria bacterium]|nr:hypothetical protein [Candidatus Saccharibacteria bacterium]